MSRRPYPTDLTGEQWLRLQPLSPSPESGGPNGGRPARDTREILDALFHRLRSGAAWRMLPHDFPPWQGVCTRFRLWRLAGVRDAVHARLRGEARLEAGAPPTPRTLRVDSRTVKTAHVGGPRGYGGGGKVKGGERLIAVDSPGMVWALLVVPARVQDRDGGCWLLALVRGLLARVREVIADAGFSRRFVEWAGRMCGRKVTTTHDAPEVLEVHPRRRVVERTLGWLVRHRRLIVGHERLVETSEAMTQAAMTHLMLRRLERPPAK